jgi:hypothetical protein
MKLSPLAHLQKLHAKRFLKGTQQFATSTSANETTPFFSPLAPLQEQERFCLSLSLLLIPRYFYANEVSRRVEFYLHFINLMHAAAEGV